MERVKPAPPVMVMTLPLTAVTSPDRVTSTMLIRPAVARATADGVTLTRSPVESAAALTAVPPSKKVVLESIASVSEEPLASRTVSDVTLAAVTRPTTLCETACLASAETATGACLLGVELAPATPAKPATSARPITREAVARPSPLVSNFFMIPPWIH